MSKAYYRPILNDRAHLTPNAVQLAGGWRWFDHAERITLRGSTLVGVGDIPQDVLTRLQSPRVIAPMGGVTRPLIMGILNTTPDSFSDGGQFYSLNHAKAQADKMNAEGADVIDIGGESTRPGADFVDVAEEIARTVPVINALKASGDPVISIDTRKAAVAQAAHDAGADWLNDVSAMSFDAEMADVAAKTHAPICLMHAQGDPKTMQQHPSYDHVLLDVYDYLEGRITVAEQAGIKRENIVVDPGIGFGKTLGHNLALIRGLSVFHGLGCAILLGASRKRFIGTITNTPDAGDRVHGSVAVALAAMAQGAHIIRVHDVAATKQAFDMAMAMADPSGYGAG